MSFDGPPPRVSIITAVHNQLAMNRFYFETLKRCTRGSHELIVIDNASTDGSREFYQASGVTVICNADNFSYPYTQNQGMQVARGEYLAFLNNDVLVGDGWDESMVTHMSAGSIDVACACGIEAAADAEETRRLKRRWKLIKNPLLALGGARNSSLRLMAWLMYGDWIRFTRERRQRFAYRHREGFVGCAVFMTRRGWSLVGPWDPRLQCADFDLYLRAIERHLTHGDIAPVQILLDVYMHHYIRLTLKARKRPPFADVNNLIQLSDKWSLEQLARLQRIDIDVLIWDRLNTKSR